MLSRWGWSIPGFANEFARVSREMDRALEAPRGFVRRGGSPSLNLYEDGDAFVVTTELPGVALADLEIQATLNTLTIKGERKADEVPEGATVHRCERTGGSFVRKVSLPTQVEPAQVKATYRLGVLEVVLPKSEATKPRTVQIEAD
ncbi:MAG: Hsp20/alpha crystallin family protein [Proteobacteria bacterium]|nr:Hsp20/alpha crystallin family protein [Pseudomonadota bacterium]